MTDKTKICVEILKVLGAKHDRTSKEESLLSRAIEHLIEEYWSIQ